MKNALIGFTLLLGAAVSAQNISINNAMLRQNTRTRVVEVTYELTGDTPAYITVGIETNGVPIPDPVTVWGDVTTAWDPKAVEPGGGLKTIYWAAKHDWPSNLTTEASTMVTAWFTNDPPASIANYIVINLAPGPSAPLYPWRYAIAGPDLNDPACKTTELWLRKIPAGTFMMGTPAGEPGYGSVGFHQHPVTLTQDFYAGIFTVTQKQWERVMGTTPSELAGDARPVERVSYDMIRGPTLGAQWPASGDVDATSFMGKLRAKTPFLFDLPTDAQWEYACRAGTTTALNSGKNVAEWNSYDANMAEVGRFEFNRNDFKGSYAYTDHTVVGLYLENAWGLYDMHGNVWEYCLDWHQADLGTEAVEDPKGPPSGDRVVIRGGSYEATVFYCRSAHREAHPRNYAEHNNKGFRACIQPAP